MYRSFRYFADVSSNNGRINIQDYSRAGHCLLAIKATQGSGYVNPYHSEQCKIAHEFGLTVLHYHWLDTSAVGPQIENFRTTYLPHWRDGDYPGFDAEEEDLTTGFINKTLANYKLLTTHDPVGYVPLVKLEGLVIPGKRLWFPDYNLNQYVPTGNGFKLWSWQFTDGQKGQLPHRCAGIGNCDISVLSRGPALALYIRKIRTRKRK